MIFVCPICKGELKRQGGAFICPNGHSHDIAAQGYVHLLPPNRMHAKIPGDNKQMIDSRREFLSGGWYAPFSQELNRLVLRAVCGLNNPVVLDAGCGEGYYTGRLKQDLPKNAELAGFDISKFAVKAAAGRYKGIEFAVASVFSIPVASEAVDCVINVFAPLAPEEFLRVLKPGGILILTVPGPRHLYGMKELLYENPYENEHRETEYQGFCFEERVQVRDEIFLQDKKEIEALFAMTPYYWKTGVEGSRRLKETEHLQTEIQFDFLVYRKQCKKGSRS